MDTEIKKLADSKDLKSLKYIFVDSLDVDPTFLRYEEEYNYCKSIPGLLEQHIELTPFTQDKSSWNEAYWTNLKMDLLKNFSDHRMAHMRDVAKVFLAEKVHRILAERAATASSATVKKMMPVNSAQKPNVVSPIAPTSPKTEPQKPVLESKASKEDRKLQDERDRLERENKAKEASIHADNVHREQKRAQYQNAKLNSSGGEDSKKTLGIAVAAVAVIVALAILLLK